MTASVTQIRPRASETFGCPCGSQWFTRAYRVDEAGKTIEAAGYMECAAACGRKHKLRPNKGKS